jgi:hypothetical protein
MSIWAIVASVLPLGVAKVVAPTIVPIPIALLTGRHGRAKSAVFTLGWFLGPIVMGNIVLLIVAAFALPGEPASTIAHALMLGLGLLCLLLTFAAIGSLLIGTPVAIAVILGKRADVVLDGLRAWLDAHGQAVVLGTLLVLGAWLVGKGLEGLLG